MRPGVLERDVEHTALFGITMVDRHSAFTTGHAIFVNMLKKIRDMLDIAFQP